MLDLNHPMTEHIFAAARAEDTILIAARHMTVATREERMTWRDNCASAFAELRRLSRDHFADSSAIPPAIDSLERSLTELAELPGIPEQGPPAEFKCPFCGAILERRDIYGRLAPENPTNIYCAPCLRIIMPSLLALRSREGGFCTDCI